MEEKTYTILVIDDEMIARAALDALLDKPNYRVEMAEDGIQGFELAKQINPDLILLDVMMPRMTGYEVCKRIRSDPQIGEVPIIMITALDDREAKLSGLVAGADDFLAKPFDSLELEIRLHTLMRVNRYRHLLEEREKLTFALNELSKKHAELRALSCQILEAQENERRHVAMELHDEIGQLITGLKLVLENPKTNTTDTIQGARNLAHELMQRVRDISLNLRPSALDDLGLAPALDGLFKRITKQTGIAIHHNVNPLDDRRFDRTIETTAFRVVQESLTNVARQAGVEEVDVHLDVMKDHMQISIVDARKGLNLRSKDQNTSVVISEMMDRVRLAGGHFNIQAEPGKGTCVMIDFDLEKEMHSK